MTPQERELVADLFDRLSRLEGAPRDADAERVIEDGLKRAPHAVYALVQTVLVQDEALKRANERIQELESQTDGDAEPPRQGGFLDSMRDALLGPREQPRGGSVPSIPPARQQQGSVWGTSGGYANPPPPVTGYAPQGGFGQGGFGQGGFGQGGSFLGTAASAAAGVIGGALLLDGIRSMFGHHGGASAYDPGHGVASSPWAGSASHGDLAREAGLDDVGRGGGDAGGHDRVGLADTSDDDNNVADADIDPDDGDFGGDDGGSDYA
ncbi:MAG: DUF2076 domain-containing protein [Xanthobacteraceae bacterium]